MLGYLVELADTGDEPRTRLVLEKATNRRFRLDLSLSALQQALNDGERPGPVADWLM
jgi:hypothetical protein